MENVPCTTQLEYKHKLDLGKCQFGNILRRLQNAANTQPAQLSNDKPSQVTCTQYTLAEVTEHCDAASCWLVVLDKVYDVTQFLIQHPGGEEIIFENAGYDATIPFVSKGHSEEAFQLLERYCIGELVEKDRRDKSNKGRT